MARFFVFSTVLVWICKYEAYSLQLPGPLVYVVTPSPRLSNTNDNQGRAAPFYYHNWMRRMDSPLNTTSITSTTTTTKTPDLIFAEFEAGSNMKSIRKLLEKEAIDLKSSTTSTSIRPIYVPDSEMDNIDDSYANPVQTNVKKKEGTKSVDMTDYFALYNNLYNSGSEAFAPLYVPSTKASSTTNTTTISTTTPSPAVQNIWHVIDSQKHDQMSGTWIEETVGNTQENDDIRGSPQTKDENEISGNSDAHQIINDNFALPGFVTNAGNGAENESRAIRTEPNLRYPYVSLKPFQITLKKPPLSKMSSAKNGNNMLTSLDNFHDLKNPVRGEAHDVIPMRQPVDRYNPAQPYLPDYGTQSKQGSPAAKPMQAVANLVPPPPPPRPSISDGNFPSPAFYDSFPPYAPDAPKATPPPSSPPLQTSILTYQSPVMDTAEDTGPDSPPDDDDSSPVDLKYFYKPPSPPVLPFVPTLPPLSKPVSGYSYDKPTAAKPPPLEDNDTPEYHGYQYNKPESPSPQSHGPDSHSYGHDYPELIYDKPQHGIKFHHDSDDHHHHDYHYHHHPTTTTTEMPRVNRYSYYYLGKKLYYLPLYFSVYFIVYVGALIIKAVLRHKIVYPNSWRPNDMTAGFFSKRSVDSWDLSNEKLHEITGNVTQAIAVAGEKYLSQKKQK